MQGAGQDVNLAGQRYRETTMITIDTASPLTATITLEHGRVNAIRLALVERLDSALADLERDDGVSMVILTGRGPFFSFGFDVPHFIGHDRNDFARFLHEFTALCTRLFLFPKPLVAAINGHAVAGGWMLAQACDARLVARGNVKLGLNEVRFGAALFAGSVEILRHLAGGRATDLLAGSGSYLSPGQALTLGLVDELCDSGELLTRALTFIEERYGAVSRPAFAEIKRLVRGPVADAYRDREAASIERFVDVWYSPAVRTALAGITIRS